jgi:hypothetical protein
MLDSSYVNPIENLLKEINRRTDKCVELHPFWKYPIWDDSYACFKLHDKIAAPERVMHLSIPGEDFLEDGQTQKLSEAATSHATREIVSFFEKAVRRPSWSTAK